MAIVENLPEQFLVLDEKLQVWQPPVLLRVFMRTPSNTTAFAFEIGRTLGHPGCAKCEGH